MISSPITCDRRWRLEELASRLESHARELQRQVDECHLPLDLRRRKLESIASLTLRAGEERRKLKALEASQ